MNETLHITKCSLAAVGLFFNRTSSPRVCGMWEQISEFLFDNYAVAGLQFENWMWLIGVPALLIFGYFFEQGFRRRPSGPPDSPSG
jgi:hypothetical protein